jgi:hypothetical protein
MDVEHKKKSLTCRKMDWNLKTNICLDVTNMYRVIVFNKYKIFKFDYKINKNGKDCLRIINDF